MNRVYFLYNGMAGFVVNKLDDLIFSLVKAGDFLGLIDLIPIKSEIKDGKILEAK